MTILLADECAARVGGRIEGEEGRAAACGGCPLRAHCLRRPPGALAVVTAVREAAWQPCRLRGRVRAVEAQVYAVESVRRQAPARRLRVVLDTCALDHPSLRAALGVAGHDFIVPEEVVREARRAPWRDQVAWAALRASWSRRSATRTSATPAPRARRSRPAPPTAR